MLLIFAVSARTCTLWQRWIRAVAEYIGQESLLAAVCKTHEASRLLIRLDNVDGSIDETWGLYKFMKSQSSKVHGRLRIFVLEDMRYVLPACTRKMFFAQKVLEDSVFLVVHRCYDRGHDESHPQKLLKMEKPRLRSGAVPNGFMGYAVNLLHLNEEHLAVQDRSKNLGGLRGSLFYSLLKELQVYDTRRNLFSAREVLTTGGISLDGGLIKERGCEDFGERLFPLLFGFSMYICSLCKVDFTLS